MSKAKKAVKKLRKLDPVDSAVYGSLSGVAKGLTPKVAEVAAPPPVAAPIVMPTPDDEAVAKAKKKSLAAILARQGRASTILSDSSGDPLGG